jgi:hypothetical protein
VSSLRNIFGGKKTGDFGLNVCQIRTLAIFYLREFLKEKMYIDNTSTGDDLKKKIKL